MKATTLRLSTSNELIYRSGSSQTPSMDTHPCLRPSVVGMASAQPPSPREPLPTVASLTHAWVGSPTACECGGSCCHHRPWDRLTCCLRTTVLSCCHTMGTSTVGFWIASLQLAKCRCAPHALLSHGWHSRDLGNSWASCSAETLQTFCNLKPIAKHLPAPSASWNRH